MSTAQALLTVRNVVQGLWRSAGLPNDVLHKYLRLTGDPDTALPSSFRLGVAAQASVALAGLSAAYVHFLNTGEMQHVTVDARHAALEFSESYYTINGTVPGGAWDDIAGIYATKDQTFVRIHTNFPHHRRGILSILQLSPNASRDAVAQELLKWNSKVFEDEAAQNGMCATAMRSFDEWKNHPQAQAIRDAPPVQLLKLNDTPKRKPLPVTNHEYKGPLTGVRVLDLTRIIAGPVCGRTLAAHGADNLWITSRNLPSLPVLDADMSRGKRTTQLDLKSGDDQNTLHKLVQSCDIFLQSYRPDGLEEMGFGPIELAKSRPGIVYAGLRAWGWEGPWQKRRGFDSLVQTALGFNADEAVAFAMTKGGKSHGILAPKPFPIQALDHSSGYLLAFGIAAAFSKIITEGGSWEVRVSLAGTGNWLRSLGRLGPTGFTNATPLPKKIYPLDPEIAELSMEVPIRIAKVALRTHEAAEELMSKDSPSIMTALKHSAILSKPSHILIEAPIGLNMDHPMWLPSAT
ncbi:CoA-transferase family III [Hysterangium stoloniferum]|nr:CoA-transferase family III [Hysterangium stoloniferum]